jgi:hypothetical protein
MSFIDSIADYSLTADQRLPDDGVYGVIFQITRPASYKFQLPGG